MNPLSDDDSPRRPLRPLARILPARDRGENPNAIEHENRRQREEVQRDRTRRSAQGRLLLLGVFFVALFGVIGVRMGTLATSGPATQRSAWSAGDFTSDRADIVDREGRVLATNVVTQALYAHPHEMVDIPRAVSRLGAIFPDIDQPALQARLSGDRKFVWLRETLSPEEIQRVHEIGEPGLLFANREMRVYPNGNLAAHILGGTRFGRKGVRAAEVIGIAGVEAAFDEQLRDPARNGAPLRLSIDLTVQAAVREVLAGGVALMNAKGASAVLMDANTGEIVAMSSLPDFDPNDRPQPLTEGDQADSPLFNRAVQGVYELGSVFKSVTVAQALDDNIVEPQTIIDTQGPLYFAGHRIRDFHDYGPTLTTEKVMVKSSNIGTARIARMIGPERQRAFLQKLGFLDPTPVELVEAPSSKPLLPKRWQEIQSMTISYGHGLSTSPLHLASGYASLLNGGLKVDPTLVAQNGRRVGPRVVSEQTSRELRKILRKVITEGTASFGDVEGYFVGGKTGSADKPRPNGGYYDDKVLATFAGAFPVHDPKYVFAVTLDEGYEVVNDRPRRTAGWTTVPVAAEMIRRVAPLLGMRPQVGPGAQAGLQEARHGG